MPPLWSNFVQQSSDLLTFLHMNSRVFLVQSSMVSLTVDREQALHQQRSRGKGVPVTARQANAESQTRFDANKSSENIARHELKVGHERHASQLPKPVNSINILPSSANTTTTSIVKPPKSLNERFRSHIIKAVTDNLQHDSRCQTLQLYSGESCHTADSLQSLQPNSDSFYDSIDLQLIKPKIVSSIKECEEVIADIFKNCTEVALDLEGINIGSSGEVTLIQVAYIHSKDFPQGGSETNIVPRVFIFDVLLCQNMIRSGLKRLLESDQIVKISHDIRNNSAALFKNFEIKLSNVFDTQVANLIIEQQSTGKPAYKPTKYISLYTLCSLYGGPNLNPKAKDKLHKIYRKDFKFWQRRPLSDDMLIFAMIDVVSLLPNVYCTMRDQIRPEYEPLFEQLTYESIFTYINTDEIKQIKRQRKFDLELTDLKMKLFNNDKKKIVLSNREIRLLRYIDLTDEIRNKIEGPQNVAKKLKRFDNKKVNGSDGGSCGEQTKHETSEGRDFDRTKRLNSSSKGDQSDDELDDLDYEEIIEDDEMGIDEEETENESVNSSLKSHEYLAAGEFISNSTDDSFSLSAAKVVNRSCCCNCHQNGNGTSNLKLPKMNGESANGGNISKNRSSEKQCHDVSTQTLSTGDIVITMIYVQEAEKSNVSDS